MTEDANPNNNSATPKMQESHEDKTEASTTVSETSTGSNNNDPPKRRSSKTVMDGATHEELDSSTSFEPQELANIARESHESLARRGSLNPTTTSSTPRKTSLTAKTGMTKEELQDLKKIAKALDEKDRQEKEENKTVLPNSQAALAAALQDMNPPSAAEAPVGGTTPKEVMKDLKEIAKALDEKDRMEKAQSRTSRSSSIVDVDALAESMNAQSQLNFSSTTVNTPSTTTGQQTIKELAAIAKKLEEKDRLEKESQRTSAPSSSATTSAIANRPNVVHNRARSTTSTTSNASRRASHQEKFGRPRTPSGAAIVGTHYVPGAADRNANTASQQQKLQQLQQRHSSGTTSRPGAHATKGQALSEKFGSAAASMENAQTDEMLKERDIGVPAGADLDVNPVLLRHLANTLPGAHPVYSRALNMSNNDGDGPVDTIHRPRTMSTMSELTAPNHSNHTGGGPMNASNRTFDTTDLVEASLVRNPSTRRVGGDEEQSLANPSMRSHPTRRTSPNMEDLDVVEDVVPAEDARLTDFLKNKTFVTFLVGYLCAIATIIALIVAIIVQQSQKVAPEIYLDEPTIRDIALEETNVGILGQYIDPNPAPAQAFEWLTQHPELDELPDWRRVQLYAMATFFHALNGKNWPSAFDRDDYLRPDVSECLWGDHYQTEADGSACAGDDERVTNLELKGSLENIWTFVELQNLTLIDFGLPETEIRRIANVRGALPLEVAFLSSLESIHIQYTELASELSDMIPSQLKQLKNLKTIHYGDNLLIGTIPRGIAKLTTLRDLILNHNKLSGTIPEFGGMPYLENLQLQNNDLTGTLPVFESARTTLKGLYVRGNNLIGTIPRSYGDFVKLTSLVLNSNRLTGTIPPELGALSQIETLSFWGNDLTGQLPSQLGLLAPTLRELDLQDTQITGRLPTELGLLTNLERLMLFDSNITGDIPTALCSNDKIRKFDVDCSKVDCDPQRCTCSCYAFSQQ